MGLEKNWKKKMDHLETMDNYYLKLKLMNIIIIYDKLDMWNVLKI